MKSLKLKLIPSLKCMFFIHDYEPYFLVKYKDKFGKVGFTTKRCRRCGKVVR